MIEQQLFLFWNGNKIFKLCGVPLVGRYVMLSMREDLFGLERRSDQNIRDVVRQVVFFEVVLARSVIAITQDQKFGLRIVLQDVIDVSTCPHGFGGYSAPDSTPRPIQKWHCRRGCTNRQLMFESLGSFRHSLTSFR